MNLIRIMGPISANGRPLAAEVLTEGDEDQLIRRRQTIEELMVLEETR